MTKMMTELVQVRIPAEYCGGSRMLMPRISSMHCPDYLNLQYLKDFNISRDANSQTVAVIEMQQTDYNSRFYQPNSHNFWS